MACDSVEGRIYTTGNSFRSLAEARQRWYRTNVLKQPPGRYGHLLELRDQPEQTRGNFVCDAAYEVARRRAGQGKGVDIERTFGNMLSSQAMCFNVFGPLSLAANQALAARVLGRYVPGLASLEGISLEYTPSNAIFGDQTGRSGVDCDVLVEFRDGSGESGVLVIETKFVEPEFSICGFRRTTNSDPCPDDVILGEYFHGCSYTRKKGYHYWEQARRLNTLAPDRMPVGRCPFSGPLWQLWVNHTLAHAIADAKQPCPAAQAIFAVCAPQANEALLRGGATIAEFAALLKDPATVLFIPLEDLIEHLAAEAQDSGHEPWIRGLRARYLTGAVCSA